MRFISRGPAIFFGGLILASLVAGQSIATIGGQAGSSLGGAATHQESYPDGSRWPTPQYEKPKAALTLKSEEMIHGRAVSSATAPLLQSELPAGVTLGPGNAVRVVLEIESSRLTGISPKAAVQPMEAPAPEGPATQATVKWIVNYPVLYKGVPLTKFSDVMTVVGGDGAVQYVRKRNLPRAVDGSEPTVDKDAAIGVGRKHAEQAYGNAALHASEASLEVWVDPDHSGHLAWTFTISSESLSDPKARRYWVSAVSEPQIISWESLVYPTHSGTVTGTLWTTSSLQPTANQALPEMQVTRTGGGGGTQVTGSDGRYGFPSGGGTATIGANLGGPFSVVANQAGPIMSESNSGTPANPIDLNFGASTEFETSQVSAFYWTTFVHNLASPILAPTDLAALPTNVNINSSCNAYWNGSSINFFKAGSGCPNTAYSDVILHEYGHGIDSSKGGILDGAYSEGFGDSMAILGTRQPCVGRDFFGSGTCLRPATDVNMWPPVPGEEIHSVGKRYAQFIWQLVQELKKGSSEPEAFLIATRLNLASAAANPSSIPDAVFLAFIADDDDGNLSNGTPHCGELAAAAASRNIPHPACPPQRLAYAWANNPTAAAYTPSLMYSYNSSGGPITVTRAGVGRYSVKFAGLGGNGIAGGHVQVTAYGPGSETCKVQNWASAGADFVVNVRCFRSPGASLDTRYTILVIWH